MIELFAKTIGRQDPVLLGAISSISLAVCLCFYYHTKNTYSFWTDRGLKGPPPMPLVGNILQMLRGERNKNEAKWLAKYGKVYGIYRGSKPFLVVGDAEVMRQIAIKDFDVFPNHEHSKLFNEYQKAFIFSLQDEPWRRARATLTPTFTSGKIKRMYKLLDVCADDLIKCLSEQLEQMEGIGNGDGIDIKEVASLYTMDGIASCCYGLKLMRQKGTASIRAAATRNEFVAMAQGLFEFSLFRMMIAFTISANFLSKFGFEIFPVSKLQPLVDRTQLLIKSRRESGKKFDDYLQLLLDAKIDDEIALDELDAKEDHHAGLTRESMLESQKNLVNQISGKSQSSKSLSEIEILSSAMFLLVVGLETTGSLITHCTYALAFHPTCQGQLYEELAKIAQLEETTTANTGELRYKFDYSQLTSCVYLDAVVSETLRLLSPAFQTDRVSNRDYYIEKYNLHIPADTRILLNLGQIMSDPDYWPEPLKFDPGRFLPGNVENIVPGSYCPFGLGPRHCLGMRFSLTEAKLAIAKIVMNYKLEQAPNTSFPPKSKHNNFTFFNIERPFVRLVARD